MNSELPCHRNKVNSHVAIFVNEHKRSLKVFDGRLGISELSRCHNVTIACVSSFQLPIASYLHDPSMQAKIATLQPQRCVLSSLHPGGSCAVSIQLPSGPHI